MVCPSAHVPGTEAQPNALRNHQVLRCGKTYTRAQSMLFHVNKHEENEMNYFQCNQCQSRFKKKERLEQHMLKKHSDFECETCGKKFPEQGSLKEHVRVCLSSKSFQKVHLFFVFRFTQGKDHISARNAVQPLASSQTSSLTGLKASNTKRTQR